MRAANIIDQDRLAYGIAADGMIPYNDAITAMVLRARAAGHRSAALDVLADPAQPEVARQRAFGKVAVAFADRRHSRPARDAA